ncbi:MAG: precorrin-6y C5,15-methyltransferase (decarboxylating) subunit CbiE [Synechococcales bacterium]|nr:precorrin-6y C5,15-methyltransferase (decarboxylating) subunit CbiE [Synechococcales bacterium]
MRQIHVVGVGLDGADGLAAAVRSLVQRAVVLVGSDRQLAYFPEVGATRLPISDLAAVLAAAQQWMAADEERPQEGSQSPTMVILASGDPLFFGIGRLLLTHLEPEGLMFHPHPSSVQLAFSRVKVPWHDACVVSAHGRSLDDLVAVLKSGPDKVAVLTDGENTPQAIARLVIALDLPTPYRFWVCENLGGAAERVQEYSPTDLAAQLPGAAAATLSVVILLRREGETLRPTADLPLMGIADAEFASFRDRPGLMTKREVRLLVLGELALSPGQVVWDVGAGTGSVAVEVARLCPSSQIYAIEKRLAGLTLIQQNVQRFQLANVIPVQGSAPAILATLPAPNRVFVGGSGGHLPEILDTCAMAIAPQGVIVVALTTLEGLSAVTHWLTQRPETAAPWHARLLQVQLARSLPVGNLTRFQPLNPVTLVTLEKTD